MAVRFQVDADFYDHPKTIGMSDAAVALWTRAGSYSVAKRTDGFIADHVLAILTKTPEVADELVERGLWKRAKGGYRYHQFAERNLTKARIDAFTEGARDRKRKQRERGNQPVNGQVKTGNVTEDVPHPVTRDIDVTHADVTPLSVYVSESVSVSSPPNPQGGKKMPRASSKATRIPEPWIVDEAMKDWAVERGMEPQWVLRHTERFVNYWLGIGGQRGTKVDWRSTWKNWLLKAQDDQPPYSTPSPVARKHLPAEVPDHIDPNDPIAYAQWAKEATQ